MFNILFPDPIDSDRFNSIFGCQDQENDCIEEFALLTQGLSWVCNTKYAFSGAIKNNPEKYGRIYPMQWGRPNCEPGTDGKNTKACHCGETKWIRGDFQQWGAKLGEKMRSTYANFYINGTFDNSLVKE